MLDVVKLTDHENLQGIAASVDAEEGIRQGLEDVINEKVRPAREFFEEFEAKHGSSKKHPVGAKADKAIASTKHS
jgi:hypothetical protein